LQVNLCREPHSVLAIFQANGHVAIRVLVELMSRCAYPLLRDCFNILFTKSTAACSKVLNILTPEIDRKVILGDRDSCTFGPEF
jgi:hypothetical protein